MPETQGRILRATPNGLVGHTKGLKEGRRGPGSPEYEFDVLNSLEYETNFFDFKEATMPIDQVGAGGVFQIENLVSATDFAALAKTATYQSHIQANMTGSDSAEAPVTVPMYLPEQNPFLEVAFDLEAVTNLELAIGFVDAIPGSSALVLGDIDTPTLHSDIGEAAVIGIDTAQTLATAALVCENGGTVTAVTVAPTTAPYGIPTAVTQVVYRVELRGANAWAFINGALVAQSAFGAGPAAATLLAAVIQFHAIGATDKEVRIDYIKVGQERADQLV